MYADRCSHVQSGPLGPINFRKKPVSVTDSVGAVSVIPSSNKASYGKGERKEKDDPWNTERPSEGALRVGTNLW